MRRVIDRTWLQEVTRVEDTDAKCIESYLIAVWKRKVIQKRVLKKVTKVEKWSARLQARSVLDRNWLHFDYKRKKYKCGAYYIILDFYLKSAWVSGKANNLNVVNWVLLRWLELEIITRCNTTTQRDYNWNSVMLKRSVVRLQCSNNRSQWLQ